MASKKITKNTINSPLREGESWSYRPTKEKDKKQQKAGRKFFAFAGKGVGMTPDLVRQNNVAKQLRETNEILLQIQKQLTIDFTNRITENKKEFNERRKALSEAKFFSKEKGLETTKKVGNFVKKTAGNLVSPLSKGFKGIFEGVWKFLTPILTGGVVIGAIEWLSNPDNHETIKNTFNWFKDNWKLLAGVGAAALLLTTGTGAILAGGGLVAVFGSLLLALKAMIILLPALGALYLLHKKFNWTMENNPVTATYNAGAATRKWWYDNEINNKFLKFMENILIREPIDWFNPDYKSIYPNRQELKEQELNKKAIGGQSGGWTLVGEKGPELLKLPLNSHIVPNHSIQNTAKLLTPPVTGNSFEIIPLPDKFITSDKTGTITTSNEATRLIKVSSVNLSNRYMVDVPEILGIR